MKKFLSILLVLTVLLTATVALVGCTDAEVTIVSYHVEYPKDKDTYSYKSGDTFQDADMVVVAVMSDKSERTVPLTNADYTKIIKEDTFQPLVDKDNKFLDVTEAKVGYITIKFLDEVNQDGYTVRVKVTVRPKG